jgi:AcrR family transcriptional regulator
VVSEGTGRVAQRRRTRKAIVEATAALLADGKTPSINDIADAADVSRRTVYMHFPTLEQLLLDATVGALSAAAGVEDALDGTSPDPAERIDALVRSLLKRAPESMPLGRRLIRLTVDNNGDRARRDGTRGYRRVERIERALEPMRANVSPDQFERLVSALAVVIGWEAMIVIRDARGLDADAEGDVMRWMARTLVEATAREAPPRHSH